MISERSTMADDVRGPRVIDRRPGRAVRVRLWRLAGGSVGFALLAGALWVLHQELGTQTRVDIAAELRALSPLRLALALLATAASYTALAGHDVVALRALGRAFRRRRALLAGFEGYAFANSFPFAFVVGGAVRRRFHAAWKVTAAQTAAIVLFNLVTYTMGLLAVASLTFIVQPTALPSLFGLPVHSTRPLGVVALGGLAAYLAWTVRGGPVVRLGRRAQLPVPPRIAVAQIAISLVDWTSSAAALYVLLPAGGSVGFVAWLGVFILGQLVALVAQVPGGLGVFEAVVVSALAPALRPAAVLSALVAYRVIYYLLPLALAAAVLGVHELRRVRHRR